MQLNAYVTSGASPPIRLLSLFSGIGGYEAAFRNLGIPHRITAYCESNKNAAQCWRTLHGPHPNLRNVRLIDPSRLDDFDLLTFSPPCQDVSRIGTSVGITNRSRTGLMWLVPPIIRQKMPAAFVMENVPQLATKYGSVLASFVAELRSFGYEVKTRILNARHFGIPQNRKRLFLVGTRCGGFVWPQRRTLTKSLQDFLDVSAQCVDRRIARTIRVGGRGARLGDRHNWDTYEVDGRPYRLSPRECLRLMGFTDADYSKLVAAGVPATTIYKVAGNAVVVPVVEAVLGSVFSCIKGESHANECC